MAFQDQVEDLTSLSVTDTGELSQFLKDGVIDVTNRWLLVRPQDIDFFIRASGEQTANDSLALNGVKIINVVREDGTNNQWRNCRKISPALQYDVTSEESLNYASKINPAYTLLDNGKINVFPSAAVGGANSFKVYYINNEPTDLTNDTALIHSHSDIQYFPADKIYLVVMYASIKLLQATMGSNVISLTSVPPDVPTLPSAPSVPSDPSISSPGVATVTVGSLGTAPTLTSTALTTRVSFNDFFESGSLNPFDDSDPLVFSVTAVSPDTPSIASVAYAAASNADATAADVTDSSALVSEQGTVDVSSSAPGYTSPTTTITGEDWIDEYPLAQADLATPLTGIVNNVDLANAVVDAMPVPPDTPSTPELSSVGTAPTYTKPTTILGSSLAFDISQFETFLETNEDTELAQVQMARLQLELGQYQAEIQNELNEFNKENVEFQATIQRETQEDTLILQKYQADLAVYQAEIGAMSAQSQGYIQTAQGYANEIKTRLSVTQTKIGEYQARVQDALNTFNRANVLFQMDFQEAVTKENQDLQVAIANATNLAQEYRQEAQQSTQIDQFNKQQDQALNLTNAAKAMEDDIADNNSKVQKFSAEIQEYQAEVGAQVQEYTQKLQRYQLEMNTAYTSWAKTESDSLQQYQLDIQANLNEFNEDNAIYQSTVQKAMKDADIAAAEALKEGDLTLQATIQNYSQELALFSGEIQNYQAEVQSKIAKYQAETVEYQAEITAETQEQSVRMQHYQLLYSQLKAEYDQAFMIAAPKQQPQQQVRA